MKKRGTIRVLTALSLVMLMAGCQSMQVPTDIGGALGSPGGLLSHAGSIQKTVSAVGKTFQDITPDQEYYIGRSVAATVLGRYRPYPDVEANHYINVLGQTLAKASDRPETFGGYHFLILDSDEINAFAAPGGLILVTRGMIRLCGSESQLAAVLAHEIGHIQGKHGLRAIKTSRITSALTVIAAEGAKTFGGGQLAQLTEVFEGSVSDIAQTLMNNGYSRDLEKEADQTAVVILRRVGYSTDSLRLVLAEMDKKMKRGGPGFAKTHPDPKDRIQQIDTKTGAASAESPSQARQIRFEQFLQKAGVEGRV